MSGGWHRVRPQLSTSRPSLWTAVVVRTAPLPDGEGGGRVWRVMLSASACTATCRSGRVSYREPVAFDDGAALWRYIADTGNSRARHHVVTPRPSDLCSLSQLWQLVVDGHASFGGLTTPPNDDGTPANPRRGHRGMIVVGGRTEIIRCHVHGRSVDIYSPHNYHVAPVADLIRPHVPPGMPVPLSRHDGDGETTHPCSAAAGLARWAGELYGWWDSIPGGVWRHTASGLAHSLYRRHHTSGRMLCHKHEAAHRLERMSIFGGRATAWYRGPIVTPAAMMTRPSPAIPVRYPTLEVDAINRLDVSSMYPHIMASEKMPTELIDLVKSPSVEDVRDALIDHGVIATVSLDTRRAEYPHSDRVLSASGRPDGPGAGGRVGIDGTPRTLYPVGLFTTTLSRPELARALADGDVTRCHEMCLYRMTDELQSFSRWCLHMRAVYKAAGQSVYEGFVKLLANGFAGKWAMRAGGWRDAPAEVPSWDWGEWTEVDYGTKARRRLRSIAGACQEYVSDPLAVKGCPAVFAYLTSYGRDYMRRVREACPVNSVYHQDTDGIYCDNVAHEILIRGGWVGAGCPGQLRHVSSHGLLHFFGARHYQRDDSIIASGFADGFRVDHSGLLSDYRSAPLASPDPHTPPHVVAGEVRVGRLDMLSDPEPIGADGWIRPVYLGGSVGVGSGSSM